MIPVVISVRILKFAQISHCLIVKLLLNCINCKVKQFFSKSQVKVQRKMWFSTYSVAVKFLNRYDSS